MSNEAKGDVCCSQVMGATERISVMEAINKTDKWWVRGACAFIILCVPFLWNKLDNIEEKITKANTSLIIHMQTIEAHSMEKLK